MNGSGRHSIVQDNLVDIPEKTLPTLSQFSILPRYNSFSIVPKTTFKF